MAEINHTSAYYANSDIDWFCRLNGTNVHVASFGRVVPQSVERTLPEVYPQVSEIEMAPWRGVEGVWYNERLVRTWLHIEDTKMIARYLSSFIVMARKGFYSFAPITFDPTDMDYYLMAKPAHYSDQEIRGIFTKEVPNICFNNIDAFTASKLTVWIENNCPRP